MGGGGEGIVRKFQYHFSYIMEVSNHRLFPGEFNQY